MILYRDRFVKGLITIGLILLIAIQLMLRFDQTQDYLRWVEGHVYKRVDPATHQVALIGNEHYVTLAILNQGYFPHVRVLINSERAHYFIQPQITFPVKDGDLIIIDSRASLEPLWFEVVGYSRGITSITQGQQFRVRNGLEVFSINVENHNLY